MGKTTDSKYVHNGKESNPWGFFVNNREGQMLNKLYDLFIRDYLNTLIAKEISTITSYAAKVWYYNANADIGSSPLFARLNSKQKQIISKIEEIPNLSDEALSENHIILLNGNLNHSFDNQEQLQAIHKRMNRSSRVMAVVYNSYLRWAYILANKFGLRSGEVPSTFLTLRDLENIAKISGFEIVRLRPIAYIPFSFFGIGTMLNKILQATPMLRWLGYALIVTMRPRIASAQAPSLSVLIPARNEKGNIENALKRMPKFGGSYPEVIFVEGHSNDGSWEEIQRVISLYENQMKIQAFKQSGKGKNDAVRLGFSKATGDLLTILDADLTMPPELLGRFYDAYVSGQADFVNGSRLVYPMEGEAMRFLNWLGNVFFAKTLSFVLDTNIGDSLCGTKLLTRVDYIRFQNWRKDFGDFDPFGDFELIYPAAILGLGIVDIPIRYRARTYGSTNIHRFRHGFMLLKMMLIGFFRVRMG